MSVLPSSPSLYLTSFSATYGSSHQINIWHKFTEKYLVEFHWKHNWGLQCQKQESRTWISKYVAQSIMGFNYLSLSHISTSGTEVINQVMLLHGTWYCTKKIRLWALKKIFHVSCSLVSYKCLFGVFWRKFTMLWQRPMSQILKNHSIMAAHIVSRTGNHL